MTFAPTDPWYPVSQPPPRRVLVRLYVSRRGVMVDGWHDLRNLQGVLVPWWFEKRGRLFAPLERVLPQPTGRFSPTVWQPLDRAAWSDPLPEPAGVSFGPHFTPPREGPPPPAPPLPAASDPVAEFEARLLLAYRVDDALPDTDRAKLRVRANWPETRPGPGDYPPEQVTRFRPTPEMVADYMVVMAHAARLDARAQRCVRLKARGYGFHWIGRGLKTDDITAQRIYRDARLRCWGFAVAAGDARSGSEEGGGRARHDRDLRGAG